jgi:hypothetical protein
MQLSQKEDVFLVIITESIAEKIEQFGGGYFFPSNKHR